METLEIRELRKDDREAMEAFFRQMSQNTDTLFNPHNCNFKELMNFFEDREEAEDHKRWIAMEDGKVAGFVFLWHVLCGVPELGIVLAENMQGRHLSKAFLDVAVNWCRDNGKGGVILTTHIANVKAQLLYESYGFEKMGPTTWTELLYMYRFGRRYKSGYPASYFEEFE